MPYSVSMLGILLAAIGGFIAIAIWDGERRRLRRFPQVAVILLIALGVALFIAGVVPFRTGPSCIYC